MPPKEKKTTAWPPALPITKRNLMYYLAGFVVLVIGFLFISMGPWDNPFSRTYGPLLLLLAYLVIFPLAVLTRENSDKQ